MLTKTLTENTDPKVEFSVDNKWAKPTPAGYAGIHMNLLLTPANAGSPLKPVVAEVQVHMRKFLAAKELLAHPVYEEFRTKKIGKDEVEGISQPIFASVVSTLLPN